MRAIRLNQILYDGVRVFVCRASYQQKGLRAGYFILDDVPHSHLFVDTEILISYNWPEIFPFRLVFSEHPTSTLTSSISK